MPTMGRYCKAYALADLRRFAQWNEVAANARTEEREVDGHQVLMPRTLTDDAYVFLHETLVVTDGLFLDEHVLFDRRSPEWEAFCAQELGFTVPDESQDGPSC
jgi:hypothetical protein